MNEGIASGKTTREAAQTSVLLSVTPRIEDEVFREHEGIWLETDDNQSYLVGRRS